MAGKSEQATASASPRLAWIGLGNMGRGMVKNLAEKGSFSGPVAIYNRTTARSEKLVDSLPAGKGKVATSIADAVKDADIIFLCVANDAAVEESIDAALKSPNSKGKLYVDCSTIHPDTSNKIGKQITEAGSDFVACPVFGAPAMADAGQLIAVLAGPAAQVDRVRPFCKGVMAKAEINFSDQEYGKATKLKIIGNTFVLGMVEALSAGHTLAEKSGLGVENLHQFVEVMFPGPYTAYSTRMMSGDYWKREEPLFTAKLARKDAGHALSLANSCGAKLKAVEVADEHLKAVVEHAGDRGDISSIYGAVRKESGLKYEN
jgi:3-hydroxyisobutyrate dehydrogenase-like beta-hydroxyacid dehydrogenase